MADKRMFTKKITESDAFLDMPTSTQALYFHLSMNADDEGFINCPKRIQRMVGASDDDMKILLGKSFLISFDTGVYVIKHWFMHNYIQSDRFHPTSYVEERKMLSLKDNKSYTLEPLDTICIQDVSPDKNSIDKNSIDKNIYSEIISYLNQICGTHYKVTASKTVSCIKARINEGYSLEDFKIVIDKKYKDWNGTEYACYLRPETLFGTKMEGYLHQPEKQPKKGKNEPNFKGREIDFKALEDSING